MLPDPGRYEERYSLTDTALGLAGALVVVGLGFLWHTHLIFAALQAVLFATAAGLALALRPVALRVDHAGISLGSRRQLPPSRAVFIPWADAEKIILYPGHTSSGDQVQCIVPGEAEAHLAGEGVVPRVQRRQLARQLPGVSVAGEPVEQDPAGGPGVIGGRPLPGRHTRRLARTTDRRAALPADPPPTGAQ